MPINPRTLLTVAAVVAVLIVLFLAARAFYRHLDDRNDW